MRIILSFVAAILSLIGLNRPKPPLTPEQELAAKIRSIHGLNEDYKHALWEAEQKYADLVVEFGIASDLADEMATAVFRQTDLEQDMDRQVTDAIERLKCDYPKSVDGYPPAVDGYPKPGVRPDMFI